MARKKKSNKLDVESLEKLYTNKIYVPPKDKELETIRELECENSSEETYDDPHKVPFYLKEMCASYALKV